MALNHVGESSHLKFIPSLIPRIETNEPSEIVDPTDGQIYYKYPFSSSEYHDGWGYNYQTWKAFDKNVETMWRSHREDKVGAFIGYSFGVRKIVSKIVLQHGTTVGCECKKFIFQGSDDGSTWTNIEEFKFNKSRSRYRQTFDIKNPRVFRQFRIYVTETYGNDPSRPFVEFCYIAFYDKKEYSDADLVDHNDVCYAVDDGSRYGEDYQSALYCWNDTCDGLIWEKRHPTSSRVYVRPGGSWLVYPREGYNIAVGGATCIIDNGRGVDALIAMPGSSKCKDFVIRAGGPWSHSVLTSKDGKTWVRTPIDFVVPNGYNTISGDPLQNRGLITCEKNGQSREYRFEIDVNTGKVSFHELPIISNVTGWFKEGGYLYFTYNSPSGNPQAPVYHMDCYGNIRQTPFIKRENRNWDWTAGVYMQVLNSKVYVMDITLVTIQGVSVWNINVAESTDGFRTMRLFTNEHFPNYGRDGSHILYYYDNAYRMRVERQDVQTGNWVTDVWYYGNDLGNTPIEYLNCPTSRWIKMVGWRTNFNFRGKLDANGGHDISMGMNRFAMVTGSDWFSINRLTDVMYFKDGKPAEPHDAIIYYAGWSPYTNLGTISVVPNDICDFKRGKQEAFEPYMFQGVTYRSFQNVINKNNQTWKLGFVDY